MIKLEKIRKEYVIGGSNFVALDKTDLIIKQGEYSSIIGPSGSGKSTLMHIIGLLDKPTGGKIYIDGKNVSSLTDEKLSHLRNRHIGFIFQQFNLLNKYTVLENIILPAIYSRDLLDFDPKERGLELLKRFGMLEKANSYPNKISGGQQQRVAIARALIMNPSLILADEPTGNLDTRTGAKILELLESLNKKEKISVVIVTHEPEVARRTKRQIKIVDGKIVKK